MLAGPCNRAPSQRTLLRVAAGLRATLVWRNALTGWLRNSEREAEARAAVEQRAAGEREAAELRARADAAERALAAAAQDAAAARQVP